MTETPAPDKQTTILKTTMRLIAERGLHATPMSLIAKESGVSAGIIYHYFDNKDTLIHELYKYVKIQFGAALMANQPATLPFPDHLRAIWLAAFHFYVTHPQETLFLANYENSPYPHTWEFDANMTQVVNLIQADMAQGLLLVMPFDVLYELTMGVAINLAKRQIMGFIDLDEVMLNALADACVRAISP